MPRNVTPEEMTAIAQLASENPDLRQVVVELAQLRTLRAATSGRAPLRPASVRELLRAVDVDLLSLAEARGFMGLPPRRGIQATLAEVWRRVLHLGVSRRQLAGAGGARRF